MLPGCCNVDDVSADEPRLSEEVLDFLKSLPFGFWHHPPEEDQTHQCNASIEVVCTWKQVWTPRVPSSIALPCFVMPFMRERKVMEMRRLESQLVAVAAATPVLRAH